jgi:predicted DCC family thiol-disulfide oxidoreductase YuxK
MALQDQRASRLLDPMEAERRMASWHLVGSDGVVRSGGGAVAPLLRSLAGGAPLAWLADRAPRTVDRAYKRIAGARGSLGHRLGAKAIARADHLIAKRQPRAWGSRGSS